MENTWAFAGNLDPASTSNLIVTNSPAPKPVAVISPRCSWAGEPPEAGVSLAVERQLPEAAAPETVRTPGAASPVAPSKNTFTPAGKMIVTSRAPIVDVPA